MISNTVVELEGANGEWFTLAGPDAGDRGVYLATGVTGLYDPPVKVVYEEPGNYPGARYLNHRILRRDIVFGVWILNDRETTGSWMSRDSEWRKAWAFDRDCILHVTTEDSGLRSLKLRLGEALDISLETDPNGEVMNKCGVVAISGDPFWYEPDVVYPAVTQTDTTFDPNPLPWPWPKAALPVETLSITVDPSDGRGGLNPTDQLIFPKWTVPGSTQAPATPYFPGIPWLGAPNSPANIWTLPDNSFEDPDQANRRLQLTPLIGGLRTNEVQKIYIDGRPTAGTFKLSLGSETTTAIPYNASPATVKAALIAFASIAAGDLDVYQEPATNEVQTLRLKGGPTSGTFTLTFDGQTTAPIPYDATDFQVAYQLAALSNIGWIDIHVSTTQSNEIQRIEVLGEPTGGTFTLTLDGQTTNPIPWNATIFQIDAALRALPNIGPNDVAVTGEKLWLWGPYNVKFINKLSSLNVNQMTGDPSGLTGGAGAAIKVTTKQEGDRLYEIRFQTNLSGLNLPQITANGAGLGGGVSPSVEVETVVDGSRPYVCTFQGALSGIDLPNMVIDASTLTGGFGVAARVVTATEGHTYPAENARIDSDPRVEQVTSESGSPLWSRMNGVRFRNYIPPYTRSHTFNVDVSGCVAGQMITLRLPRPWSRPWGLE